MLGSQIFLVNAKTLPAAVDMARYDSQEGEASYTWHRSLCRGVQISQDLKKKHGPKLKDFKAYLETNVPPEIAELKSEVEHFAKQFPTIGFEKAAMRYKD